MLLAWVVLCQTEKQGGLLSLSCNLSSSSIYSRAMISLGALREDWNQRRSLGRQIPVVI